ncbi:hypothetical protein [Streptococcus sp. S784/96/1]|uniref:hypothetical protein n=1 Tax=Streptococcus sp. S784/96/1 TaxID=2653499 RepID=UPI00138A2417|nr:hypothetical protein [Streptococcus sp. S784/96/1]
MDNIQFWQTLGTSAIPAAITGLLSFLASWSKNKAELKSLEKQFTQDMEKLEKQFIHDMEKMELTHKHQIENIERQHTQELDALKQSHELRLQELEKVSQLDAQTDLSLKQNDLAFKVLTGEVDLDSIVKVANKSNQYNQKQQLQAQFTQKLSKK